MRCKLEVHCGISSGKKKEPKPKLFGPDVSGWGGGLPRERVGSKKFGMSFETQGNLAGYPGILPGYPGGARKVAVQIGGVPPCFLDKLYGLGAPKSQSGSFFS